VALLLLLAAGCSSKAPTPDASLPPPSADAEPAKEDPATTLLGGERGVDHVGIAVRDLEAATHTYHDLLGFNRPTEGKLPNGIRNINYYFADATYLETLVHWDREKAPWLANFTDKHEGALFGVLSAFSPDSAREFLAQRNIKVSSPYSGTLQSAGEKEMPGEKWKTFFLPKGQLPGDPLYFISYPRADRDGFLRKLGDRNVRRIFYHDNTALGLRAMWMATDDLEKTAAAYEAIGLTRSRRFQDEALDADAISFTAGAGELWLLAAKGKKGPVVDFLKARGPGIIGVTVMAGNIQTATRLIEERTKRKFPSYTGPLGNSFRVPADLTHGVIIEFAQYLVPAKEP